MQKRFLLLVFFNFFIISECFSFSSKVVCTVTEAIDNQRAIFFFDVNTNKNKFFLKGISTINSKSEVEKTGKTNIELSLNKNSREEMLVLETSELSDNGLVVFTIFINELNGIFQSFSSSSSNSKTEVEFVNFSCSQLESFPF